jgi:hypothetical protein
LANHKLSPSVLVHRIGLRNFLQPLFPCPSHEVGGSDKHKITLTPDSKSLVAGGKCDRHGDRDGLARSHHRD